MIGLLINQFIHKLQFITNYTILSSSDSVFTELVLGLKNKLEIYHKIKTEYLFCNKIPLNGFLCNIIDNW